MLTRRRFLGTTALALGAAASPIFAAPSPSKKKGWAGGSPGLHAKFGATWFYDWTGNGRGSAEVEFVPMVKSGGSLAGKPAANSTGPITALLGFNEPERASQGNLSVDAAIARWPQLVELAQAHQLRLGSPAPSSDGGGMAWLAAFMEKASRAKLQVDFVALHWYRGRDPAAFANWLGEMHRKFRRPLWLTEFNGWAGTPRENETFLRSALRTLEHDHAVERYAYFNPAPGHVCALLAADRSLTKLGELYRDA